MKAYADNLEYQGFMSALEEAKNVFEAAKTKTKEIKAVFKATKKEDAPKAKIYAARFQFKQAKLKQKFQKLALCVAALDLAGFVHSFKETQKESGEIAKKAEATKKEKPKKAVDSHTDAVATSEPKAGKTKKSSKVAEADTVEIVATSVGDTKKTEKTKGSKKGSKKQVVEAKEVVKVKITKAAKKEAAKVQAMAEMPDQTAKVEVIEAQPLVESTVKAAESTPTTPQTVVKNEVVILKRTPINDLTIIEGIGPKVAKILYDKGVKNFKTLIASPVEDIKTWLKENKLPFIDPSTWAQQAQLADEGKMIEFEALKKELKGGKRAE